MFSYRKLTSEVTIQKLFRIHCRASTRFTTYIIGVIFGYYVDAFESGKLKITKISKKLSSLFWMGSILTFCVIFYDFFSLLPDAYAIAAYIYLDAVYKVLLSLSVGWITIACHIGNAYLLNKFLSNNVFKFLAKFSFSIYMVHLIVQYIMVSRKPTNYIKFELNEFVSSMSLL